MSERREVVVVGAGLTGLSAAAELGSRGLDVLCLEQAEVGHEWSGSKGDSRIFRFGYDDPLYVGLARRSLDGWRSLEAAAGEALLLPCGLLSFGAGLDELAAGMAAAGGDPQWLDAGEVARRYPGFRIAGDAVLDPSAGVLLADRVLAALAGGAGGRFELRPDSPVRSLTESGSSVVLRLDGSVVEASVVVVCAGPWTPALLATAGIPCRTQATLEQVVYFDPPAPPAAGGLLPAVAHRGQRPPAAPPTTEPGRFGATRTPQIDPVPSQAGGAGEPGRFGVTREPQTDPVPSETAGAGTPERLAAYGLPSPARGMYKLGLHYAGPPVVPGEEGVHEPDVELTARTISAARDLFNGVDPVPRGVERCVYDNTVDGDFVLDRVGRIVVGAGTSGHGFKFGPALGRILADLATGEAPEVELSRFRVARPAVRD